MKYKVGDRVRVVDIDDNNYSYEGIVVVSRLINDKYPMYWVSLLRGVDGKENAWDNSAFNEEQIERVKGGRFERFLYTKLLVWITKQWCKLPKAWWNVHIYKEVRICHYIWIKMRRVDVFSWPISDTNWSRYGSHWYRGNLLNKNTNCRKGKKVKQQ